MVPVQLRYTNVSSWRVASDAQAGGDDAQLVCEHQLCRWQWYCWMFYSAKHLFLSDRYSLSTALSAPQTLALSAAELHFCSFEKLVSMSWWMARLSVVHCVSSMPNALKN